MHVDAQSHKSGRTRKKEKYSKTVNRRGPQNWEGDGDKGPAPKLQGSSSSLPLMKCANVSSWGS